MSIPIFCNTKFDLWSTHSLGGISGLVIYYGCSTGYTWEERGCGVAIKNPSGDVVFEDEGKRGHSKSYLWIDENADALIGDLATHERVVSNRTEDIEAAWRDYIARGEAHLRAEGVL
jgi:hypothetical protein